MQLEDVQRFCDEVKSRYETASLDHSRQHEESLRHWEAERRVLVARWEEELRSAREEAAKKHDDEWAAAQARQQLLHDQLEGVRRQFEQENHALRGDIDALQSEFSGIRAEAEEARRLREACDQISSKFKATIGQDECLHCSKIDAMPSERSKARQPVGVELQNQDGPGAGHHFVQDEQQRLDVPSPAPGGREAELITQIQVYAEFERQRAELAAECQADREQSSGLAKELEAMVPVQLAVELERATAVADSLRNEVLSLQETVQRLQQDRDAAIEKMGIVRFDRDQLHDSHAHTVARLQELEEYHRTAVERLSLEVAEARRQADIAINRQAFKSIPLQSVSPRIDREPQVTPSELPRMPEVEATLPVEPTVEPQSAPATESLDLDRCDRPEVAADPVEHSDPTPESPDLTVHQALEVTEAPVETIPPPKSVATEPVAVGSPEDRIQSLRNYLRVVHEGGSEQHMCRPLFARLTRVWRKSRSE